MRDPIDLVIDIDEEDVPSESTLEYFSSVEEYSNYYKLRSDAERDRSGPWGGPGWYQAWIEHVPCGHGCCTAPGLFMRPAEQATEALQRARQEIEDALQRILQLKNREEP